MSKRTIEVNDKLQEIVDSCIEDVKDELLEYLWANPETDALPDLGNDLDYDGSIHSIIDGAVPVYTNQITDIMYLHGHRVEQAFDDAGIGTKDDKGWPNGWKAAAVYCYIEQQVHEWYNKAAQDVFDGWVKMFEEKQQELTMDNPEQDGPAK